MRNIWLLPVNFLNALVANATRGSDIGSRIAFFPKVND